MTELSTVPTWRRTGDWRYPDIPFCLTATPPLGSNVASRAWFGSSDAGVYEVDWSLENPERVRYEGDGHTSYVTGIALCGDLLVSCGYDRKLVWWDPQERRALRSTIAHEQWIRRVVAFPDGRRFASVADDMRCRVWDAADGECLADFSDHALLTPQHYPSMLYALAISDDGKRLATGDRTGHVAVWDAETFQLLRTLEAPVMYTWDPVKRRHSIGGIRSLSFSPDGTRLAVGGMGQVGNIDHLQGPSRLEVFDLASGDRLVEVEDQKKQGLIEQIAWLPGGNSVLVGGGAHEGFFRVIDAASGEQLQAFDQPGHVHAFWHDADFSNLLVAAHQRVSRWTTRPEEKS